MSAQKITWTVSPDEAQTILNALHELPFKSVAAIIPRLVAEANAQLAPAADPADPSDVGEPERFAA